MDPAAIALRCAGIAKGFLPPSASRRRMSTRMKHLTLNGQHFCCCFMRVFVVAASVIFVNFFFNRGWRDGLVLRSLVALAENLVSAPTTEPPNSSSGGSDTLWTP